MTWIVATNDELADLQGRRLLVNFDKIVMMIPPDRGETTWRILFVEAGYSLWLSATADDMERAGLTPHDLLRLLITPTAPAPANDTAIGLVMPTLNTPWEGE